MKAADIRQLFIDFFRHQHHEHVSSSSLVPQDPTLLFTNAGMVQFKNLFTGNEARSYKRAVTSQKCVRAGGKHNDLNQVGFTARHHTFFEMLGNFSFSDYFKEKAIEYAWTFLTKEVALNPKRLWVTVYYNDDEAATLWKKIAGLSEERIIRIHTQDNFWAMGDTGPCGPCSEIFYDHGDHIFGGLPGTPDQDGDRFVELWNLVFMQFERTLGQEDKRLPSPSIDTGMGLERITAVLQGVSDNFDTDLFKPIIQASENTATQGLSSSPDLRRIAHRVLADHARSASFLMADGVLPSSDGRGYVLRRIIRRALRYGQYVSTDPHHLAHLVPSVLDVMGQAYPELLGAAPTIIKVLEEEGQRFHDILRTSCVLIQKSLENLEGTQFCGEKAFQLYDTHGIPVDFLEDILADKGLSLDHASFNLCMERQKQASRQSWTGSGDCAENEEWVALNHQYMPSHFCGYDTLDAETELLLLLKGETCTSVDVLKGEGAVLTSSTPFYAESGGQIGDIGWICSDSGKMRVTSTEKRGHLFLHIGKVEEGQLTKGESAQFMVDSDHRSQVRANHTATHLLQSALKKILGNHVSQKGSLVTAHRLRFDFNHGQALEDLQLQQVEDWVNAQIRQNHLTSNAVMPKQNAIALGAVALFGEKYGDNVRVIRVGNSETETISIELCGGTHVDRTGDIGVFKIISERSLGSGIRRIEAVTGKAALQLFQEVYRREKSLAYLLKADASEIETKLKTLLSQTSAPKTPSFSFEKEFIGNKQLWSFEMQEGSVKEARGLIDQAKSKLGNGLCVILVREEKKATVLMGVSGTLIETCSADGLLKHLVHQEGWEFKGNGRQDFAQSQWVGTYGQLLNGARHYLQSVS